MKKTNLLLVFVLLLAFSIESAYSQQLLRRDDVIFKRSYDFGLTGGLSSYFGQLSYGMSQLGGGAGVYFRYNPIQTVSVRFDAQYLNESSIDWTYGRNFSANTFNLTARCEVNVLKSIYPQNYSLYLFTGVGAFVSSGNFYFFDVKYDANGKKEIGPLVEKIDPRTGKSFNGRYTNFSVSMPIGIGFKYRIVPEFMFGLELMTHIIFSDNVDNFRKSDAPNSSKQSFDVLPYLGITLGYNIITSPKGVDKTKKSRSSYQNSRYRKIY